MKDQDKEDERDYYEEEGFTRSNASTGDLLSFNVEHGFLEAVVRGFKCGFLNDMQYHQLTQCENLEDVKISLSDTDFYACLSNCSKLTPQIIVSRCWDKFVEEFEYLRSQAVDPLNTFLNFISYEYMLDNITLLIKSISSGVSEEEILLKCDPLGRFPQIKSLLTFEPTEEGFKELYNLLIDTPVAPYFVEYFSASEVKATFTETDIEIITNMLKRYWLEDFYEFCLGLGGTTAEIMKTLLEFEADRRAIAITYNSFGTPLNNIASMRENERKDLYCNFGTLYPEVTDFNSLRAVLEKYEQFNKLLTRLERTENKELEPVIMGEEEVELCKMAFDQQSHLACFYAFVKLKLQEKMNIYWITQCIFMGQQKSTAINRYIPIFSKT